jgi:hypothetical protein
MLREPVIHALRRSRCTDRYYAGEPEPTLDGRALKARLQALDFDAIAVGIGEHEVGRPAAPRQHGDTSAPEVSGA